MEELDYESDKRCTTRIANERQEIVAALLGVRTWLNKFDIEARDCPEVRREITQISAMCQQKRIDGKDVEA